MATGITYGIPSLRFLGQMAKDVKKIVDQLNKRIFDSEITNNRLAETNEKLDVSNIGLDSIISGITDTNSKLDVLTAGVSTKLDLINTNLGIIATALHNWAKPGQLRQVKVPTEADPEVLEDVSLHTINIVVEDVGGVPTEVAVGVIEDSNKKIRAVKAQHVTIPEE